MDRSQLQAAFSELRDRRQFDRASIARSLEEVIRELLKEKFGTDEVFDVRINPDTGVVEIWWAREVVPVRKVKDPLRQVSIREAKKKDADLEVGDVLYEQLDPEKVFGRRYAARARELLLRRLDVLKKQQIYERYQDKVGEIVQGEVYQVLPTRDVLLLDDDGIELLLPAREQIGSERFRKGDLVRVLVKQVKMTKDGPRVIVSRTDPRFLAKLLEQEVVEIMDGLIKILKIVRIPGKRAKVLVQALDDRIDPVGAIVGVRGSRIHGIVRELRGETIDIIPYTPDPALLIAQALTPATVNSVELDEEKRYAKAYIDPEEVSLAIGREGLNIKLASKLTGYEIDVYRDEGLREGDIPLTHLKDLLGEAIVNAFVDAGIETVFAVLDYSMEDLKRLVDLEPELVEEAVRKITVYIEEKEKRDASVGTSSGGG